MKRFGFGQDHDLFRESVRAFVDSEIRPNDAQWERAGIVDRELFRKAGSRGFLGMAIPEEYGGGGVSDFRINAVFVDRQIEVLNAGELNADDAAKAKWWISELEMRVVDNCLQMFGG